jgi:hypothetical protein
MHFPKYIENLGLAFFGWPYVDEEIILPIWIVYD